MTDPDPAGEPGGIVGRGGGKGAKGEQQADCTEQTVPAAVEREVL